jgi:hypothetical protein
MTNLEDELFDAIEEAGFINLDYYHKYNKEDLRLEDFITLFFKEHKIEYFTMETTDAYKSAGYACEVISVAWIEDNKLRLTTILVEEF